MEVNKYSVKNRDVALALARNPDTPEDVISVLENNEDLDVLLALLGRGERGERFSEKVVAAALKGGAKTEDIKTIPLSKEGELIDDQEGKKRDDEQ